MLKNILLSRAVSGAVVVCFVASAIMPSPVLAQAILLPEPGTMVVTSARYVPVILKGLTVHADDPLLFDFVVDTGLSGMDAASAALRPEAAKLVKYFLASLTIPEKDQWVNLSPYEKNRIMADDLARTDLGRDMLAQDYLLKQVTASLVYPEKELGKSFWDRIYKEVKEKFGLAGSEIPMDSISKVWVVADKANVYVNRNKAAKGELTAYIVGSHLKVMLETDYMATSNAANATQVSTVVDPTLAPASDLIKQIQREIIIPAIEKEVNEGKNFANLRQLFHSMVLATWYKKALKEAFLAKAYADKQKTAGVEGAWARGRNDDVDPPAIYAKYVEAYKKGAFNYIKEDIDQTTGEPAPHKYFSGGLTELARADEVGAGAFSSQDAQPVGHDVIVSVRDQLEQGGTTTTPAQAVTELNKQRPAGYPQGNVENRPPYTSAAVLDPKNIFSPAYPRGYAHPNLDTMASADKARFLASLRAEIHRFAPWTKWVNHRPRNPVETGMTGRGDLGRYGPNPAEDNVILRYNEHGGLEVLVIDREDGGGMALPGVLLNFGEENHLGLAASRRLYEETNVTLGMKDGTLVYEGPASDWRDTNDAWVITRGIAKVLSYESSCFLQLKAKKGAREGSARFVPVDRLEGMYARHQVIIENALAKVRAGLIKTTEDSRTKKFAPLNITMTQIEKAFQAFKEGKTELTRTFDVVIPKAPHGGNYNVVAGIEPLLNDVRRLRFLPEHIAALREKGYFTEEFLNYLANFQFQGDIDAIQEGRMVAEGVPLMRIGANDVEIELLSVLLQNRIGQAVNIATKTARIAQAANGDFVREEMVTKLQAEFGLSRDQIKKVRGVLDFGLRRGQGEGAFLAARAAIIGGAIGTSNERAAKAYDLTSMGSMAHAFIMMFPPEDEIEAFRLYVSLFPKNAILLVDTYDTLQGVRHAITVAKEMEARGEKLFGIRLDSGDIAKLSREARQMLDDAGLHYVNIVASDDLDENKITDLLERGARIDIFGVGTNLITGGEQATLKVDIVPSDAKRYWRSMVNGKVEKYITTPSGRTAYSKGKQQVSELLLPVWRQGRRRIGVEQVWSAHERSLSEMGRLGPDQKPLNGSALAVPEHQDNDLTINPATDVALKVDDQDAFKPGSGGLPVGEGHDIERLLNRSMELFDPDDRYVSLDRHERGSVSWNTSYNDLPPFTLLTYDMVKDWTEAENRLAPHAKFTLAQLKDYLKAVGFQVLWPEHADARLGESKLPSYDAGRKFRYVQIKGMDPLVDSYSPFEDNRRRLTGLADVIRKNKPGTKRIFLAGGLAFDYCVGFAAIGAVNAGFEVILVRDATRSVGAPEGSTEAMEKMLMEKGVKIVNESDLLVAANNTKGVYPAPILEQPFAHPPLEEVEESAALDEDKYHLTMAYGFFKGGHKDKTATFDYFFRKAPYGGDRIVLSGLRILAERLRNFKFTPDQIQHLRAQNIYSEEFLTYLANFKFTGNIDTLPEGSICFANEPLFKVSGPLIEVLIIEALVLNKLNFNSLISTLANNERLSAGDIERLIEDGMAGAQGESHVEASLASFIGGSNATTNVDAHLNYGLPIAWSNDEGRRLGADLVTGGEKSSLGGVYKMAMINGEARIKLGSTPIKTSRPGDKQALDIVDADGRVIDRVTALVGETLTLPAGQEAVSRYVPFARNGDIVFVPQDPFEVQAFRAAQNELYAGVHESRMSPELAALQQKMIDEIRGADATANAAMKGGIDFDAGKMTLTESGDKAELQADPAMMARFERGDFAGIRPVIVRVTAAGDVQALLGLK